MVYFDGYGTLHDRPKIKFFPGVKYRRQNTQNRLAQPVTDLDTTQSTNARIVVFQRSFCLMLFCVLPDQYSKSIPSLTMSIPYPSNPAGQVLVRGVSLLILCLCHVYLGSALVTAVKILIFSLACLCASLALVVYAAPVKPVPTNTKQIHRTVVSQWLTHSSRVLSAVILLVNLG